MDPSKKRPLENGTANQGANKLMKVDEGLALRTTPNVGGSVIDDGADGGVPPEVAAKIEANRLAALQRLASRAKSPSKSPAKIPVGSQKITSFFSSPSKMPQGTTPSSQNPPETKAVAETRKKLEFGTASTQSLEEPVNRASLAPIFGSPSRSSSQLTSTPKRMEGSAINDDAMDVETKSVALSQFPTSPQKPASSGPRLSLAEQFSRNKTNSPTKGASQALVGSSTPNHLHAALRESESKSSRPLWLDDPCDANMRKRTHPDYDPSTIYISPADFGRLTETKKEYWKIKKNNFDTVVFYQQGDFFNMFGPDADISVRDFGFVYNANLDSVGFNRKQLGEWTKKFVHAGYKVMVVEQTSTATTDEDKKKKQMMKKKTEDRAVGYRVTPGTMRDFDMLDQFSTAAQFVMAVHEEIDTAGNSKYGVCFVDASTYEFGVAFIEDDSRSSQLETLLLRIRPVEILYDRATLTPKTKKLISVTLLSPVITTKSFPETSYVDEFIIRGGYFGSTMERGVIWPAEISDVVAQSPLVSSAVGAMFYYFDELKFASEIIPRAKYFAYNVNWDDKYLQLDSMALSNLEILENSSNYGVEGTLVSCLDHTVSPFGKRLLRKWLCHPLQRIDDINNRLDAVEFLMSNPQLREVIQMSLARLADAERMVSRVASCAASLAVFIGLLRVIDSLQSMSTQATDTLTEAHEPGQIPSELHRLLVSFPDLSGVVSHYSFEWDKALRDGRIDPMPGLNPVYDESVAEKTRIIGELDTYLKREVQQAMGIRGATYYQSKTESYTISIPTSQVPHSHPKGWERLKALKSEERFTTPETRQLVMELQEAEAAIESSTSQTLMECMASFGQFRDMVDLAIANSAELDVLCSLAQFCLQTSSEMTMCRPELVRREPNGGPIFEVQGMKHPYVRPGGETFIPNDLALGDATPAIMLITGPNMGGKSTILRQVCITAIMAQLGCYVAAESCRMSPVDRIFTRLGARDHIMAGKSTFFVELEETSKILHEASPDSLVILDELGRGTSTFDGYSIAYAVLKHLQNTQSRVLFSTHYHKLCDEFNQSAGMIQQAYMDCRMYHERITFLYKLVPGASPSSFGLDVARMALLPEEVLQRAHDMSQQLATLILNRKQKKEASSHHFFVRLYQLLSVSPIASPIWKQNTASLQQKLSNLLVGL